MYYYEIELVYFLKFLCIFNNNFNNILVASKSSRFLLFEQLYTIDYNLMWEMVAWDKNIGLMLLLIINEEIVQGRLNHWVFLVINNKTWKRKLTRLIKICVVLIFQIIQIISL